MNKKISDAIKKLDMEKIGQDLAQQLKIAHEKRIAFSKTDRFKDVINKLKETVKTQGAVSDFDYSAEGFLFSDVTHEEFDQVFLTVFALQKDNLKENKDWSEEYVSFHGLRFTQVFGQGSFFCVTVEKAND